MKYEQMKRNDAELSLLCAADRIATFVRKEFPELDVQNQLEVMWLAMQGLDGPSRAVFALTQASLTSRPKH